MKILYFIIGLLAGVLYASNTGLIAIENRDWQYDRDITAYTLTGMNEGWERGRFWTEQKLYWHINDLVEELTTCYQGQRDLQKRYKHGK